MSDNLSDLLQQLYRRNVEINRRQLLRLAGLGLEGAVLAACAGPRPTQVPFPTTETIRLTEVPTRIIEQTTPEPTIPRGRVERDFADSVLIASDSESDYFPNISETILEIGYKPTWIFGPPDKETIIKYPAVIYLGELAKYNRPFEDLQKYITQQDGGLIVFGYAIDDNSQFNFSGIEYKERSGRYGDYVVKFDPKSLETSHKFVATGIIEHPITRGMRTLTIGSLTIALHLQPSCEADLLCQGIVYGGENTYTESGDIQNPPLVAVREYLSGGRIVVGPISYNFNYDNFGGEDNVQLIRNSLLWILHKI